MTIDEQPVLNEAYPVPSGLTPDWTPNSGIKSTGTPLDELLAAAELVAGGAATADETSGGATATLDETATSERGRDLRSAA